MEDAFPVGAGSPTAIPMPPSADVTGVGTPRTGGASTQVHAVGQSPSTAQVVAFGVQTPTVLIVVVQLSGGWTGVGLGSGATPPSTAGVRAPVEPAPPEAEPVEPVPVMPGDTVPVDAVPVPEPPTPPPEHMVIVGKVQENPSPQSASTLQASCHLYMQVETLVVVHVGGVDGAKQSAFGWQVEPPEHAMIMSVWHTIVAPQSASVLHDASMHVPVGVVFVGGVVWSMHLTPAGHEGGAATGVGAMTI
jgi:hypothetical protein